ncbi:MAG: hypothetical protein L0K86_29615, partial [Actinomycetia bacterium]|nr:hypothetical protein [Actinomycetes bacterium]
FAPGVDLVSTYAGDGAHEKIVVPGERGEQPEIEQFSGWASWSGTSFAAAVVTGQIAAMLDAGANAEKAVATVRQRYARGDRGLAKP